jgi:hypothetical protein
MIVVHRGLDLGCYVTNRDSVANLAPDSTHSLFVKPFLLAMFKFLIIALIVCTMDKFTLHKMLVIGDNKKGPYNRVSYQVIASR